MPGLTHKASHYKPQSKPDEGVHGSDDPQGGGDGPGGLVEDPSNHGDDDDEKKADDRAHLLENKPSPEP